MTGRTISHYQVIERLGEGGMGVVYKARDIRLDRLVALKFLPPERVSDEERKRRFVWEARAASALNHPNIVTVYDIDQCEGADFIAMEYVAGRTLSQVVAEKPLAAKDVIGYAVQIADALGAAHRAGIIHRDLKPGNLMITEDGRVKVLDFGLAKLTEFRAADDQATLTLVAGTAGYMAPEQAEGRAVDARTDIYAFGAVLYEMLAGRRAFMGLAREEPPPPKEAPEGLRLVVARCLRRAPAERFQSAAELKTALEEASREPQAAPSIAVLPFVNLSADKENEYFSDGLAEEIINALTKAPGLRVMARTSSFYFRGKDLELREIAARLNVEHILEGSVRIAGGRIRVTAQLINAASGYHLWSERYDRRMAGVFEIQDEIAQAIVERLRVQLAGQEPLVKRHTASPEAYDFYLRGRYCMSTAWLESAPAFQQYFKQATLLDPRFALAHAGLAESYISWNDAAGLTGPQETIRMAKAAALEALALDDSVAEAHMVLGIIAAREYDWRRAEDRFRRALELNPMSPVCRDHRAVELLAPLGRLDEAQAELTRALEQDPLCLWWQCHQGFVSYLKQDYEAALTRFRRVLELNPHYSLAHFFRVLPAAQAGRFEEAIAAAEAAVRLAGRGPTLLALLGYVVALAGRRSEAANLLDELTAMRSASYVSPACLGWVYLGLGETGLAMKLLEQGVEDHSYGMLFLAVDPLYGPIRRLPLYAGLMEKMKLTP